MFCITIAASTCKNIKVIIYVCDAFGLTICHKKMRPCSCYDTDRLNPLHTSEEFLNSHTSLLK